MQPAYYPQRVAISPVIRFVGDAETGIVHSALSTCAAETSEAFLDLRTAIVRGYSLCACCR